MSWLLVRRRGFKFQNRQIFRYFLNSTIILLLIQLAFYRLISRVSIFIPKSGFAQQIHTVLVETGLLAGELVFWLVLVLAVMQTFLLWLKQRTPAIILMCLTVLVASGISSIALNNITTSLAILVCLVGISTISKSEAKRGDRYFVLIITLAVLFSLLSSLVGGIAQELTESFSSKWISMLFDSGQLLLLLAGPILLVGQNLTQEANNSSIQAAVIMAGATLITALFLLANYFDPYTTATLMQWGVGLSLNLPPIILAFLLWSFLMGLGRMATGDEPAKLRFNGLALVLLAGYHLPLTYDLLAAVVGLTIMIFGGENGISAPRFL